MAPGMTAPEITLRNGMVLPAQIPSNFADIVQVSDRKSSTRVASSSIQAEQLRFLLQQYLRRSPSTPEASRFAIIRDSLRSRAGNTETRERFSDRAEIVARSETRQVTRDGQGVRTIVVEVRNPGASGSIDLLAKEE